MPLPSPLPDDGYPDGPEEMQMFSYTGFPESISYSAITPTEFPVVIHVSEEGIPGLPSQLLGFAVCCQYSNAHLLDQVSVVWSDWIMNLNNGEGPDVMIGGFAEGEISMGVVGNIDLPFDYWYLGEDPQPLVIMTLATKPEELAGQSETISFTLGDSIATNATNEVVVCLPDPAQVYNCVTSGASPVVSGWEVFLEEE